MQVKSCLFNATVNDRCHTYDVTIVTGISRCTLAGAFCRSICRFVALLFLTIIWEFVLCLRLGEGDSAIDSDLCREVRVVAADLRVLVGVLGGWLTLFTEFTRLMLDDLVCLTAVLCALVVDASSLLCDWLRFWLTIPGLADRLLKAGLLDREHIRSFLYSLGEVGALPIPLI